jgi:hypothetical protein
MEPKAGKPNEPDETNGGSPDVGMDVLIEGGAVTELRELEVKPPHREATARWLAIILVSILGGSALLHYITLAIFVYAGKADEADRLGTFFNAWLPAITALVGSATTYYFTKDKR